MPLRATDNPLVLPLLGLLLERPRHQYALLADLRDRYRHLRVRTGSVYTLVRSLQDAGWIEPASGDSGSDASAPVAFRLTPAGTAEVRRRVVADIEDTDPANAARFVTALAYVGILDRPHAVAALTTRVEALRQRADELEQAIATAGLPEVFMVEVAFFASQTRHDLAWIERFVAQVRDPAYEWPAGPR
ncbi:PadR family transcriptional regulator [Micromonospora sp. URMC 103]|uniref:PadR family transcriptional regulator n=1 Tax=Micromonospora sp. URMC 103 TaxID=3423406 RepID=UPI003F1AB02C